MYGCRRSSEVYCNVLKDELPDRDTITNSISEAERETAKASPDIRPNYGLIKDYIIRTYDYLAAQI